MEHFAEKTTICTYKGHTISQLETPVQIAFIIDDDLKNGIWSIADAKRVINGKQTTYEPVNLTSWFK